MVAEEENYAALEERGVTQAIRIPSNDSLERDIADLLTRPVGRPSHKSAVRYNVFPCPDDTPLPFLRGTRVARDRIMRERLGDKEIDLNTFASARAEGSAVIGMTAQIEEAPNSVTLGWRQCPIYEGFQIAGLEHDTIEAMCKRGTVLAYAEFNKPSRSSPGA